MNKPTQKIKEPMQKTFVKFKINQICWYMSRNSIVKTRIKEITIRKTKDDNIERIYKTETDVTMLEDFIYQTKKALINKLYLDSEEKEDNGKT